MTVVDDQTEAAYQAVAEHLALFADPAEVKAAIHAALAELAPLEAIGLTVGQHVRFRHNDRGGWRHGRVRGVNADGSIDLTDTARAWSRAIPAENIQYEHVGPRGGTSWKDVVDG